MTERYHTLFRGRTEEKGGNEGLSVHCGGMSSRGGVWVDGPMR